jgi:hypothetical protein
MCACDACSQRVQSPYDLIQIVTIGVSYIHMSKRLKVQHKKRKLKKEDDVKQKASLTTTSKTVYLQNCFLILTETSPARSRLDANLLFEQYRDKDQDFYKMISGKAKANKVICTNQRHGLVIVEQYVRLQNYKC